ncbi:MAG TPA: DUF1405 domain-containing protein [Pseudogracilibacillus sp.]|nr:DUF1405 domain-containing protein [Pseudogracilibacillus sp.]
MLTHQYFLIALLVVNLFGTVYGYIWYESQLTITPIYFMPFVPDSPTATLFFTVWILFYLFKTRTPYIEALALTSLFKYGLWAVVMNVLTLIVEGTLSWQGYMLIASHGAMALQGLLYIPFYKFSLKHLTVAGIILLHNDIIDYVFDMMPIYYSLTDYIKPIGYFTFWLSVLTILMTYWLVIRQKQTDSI